VCDTTHIAYIYIYGVYLCVIKWKDTCIRIVEIERVVDERDREFRRFFFERQRQHFL
jgi:hypothetical protein